MSLSHVVHTHPDFNIFHVLQTIHDMRVMYKNIPIIWYREVFKNDQKIFLSSNFCIWKTWSWVWQKIISMKFYSSRYQHNIFCQTYQKHSKVLKSKKAYWSVSAIMLANLIFISPKNVNSLKSSVFHQVLILKLFQGLQRK